MFISRSINGSKYTFFKWIGYSVNAIRTYGPKFGKPEHIIPLKLYNMPPMEEVRESHSSRINNLEDTFCDKLKKKETTILPTAGIIGM